MFFFFHLLFGFFFLKIFFEDFNSGVVMLHLMDIPPDCFRKDGNKNFLIVLNMIV